MAANTQKINAKNVAKYILLPGIIPRAKELGSSGFGYLAFLFARVYGAVRILPKGHRYLNPDNIGTFGILQVIAAAANHIEFNRYNIDKIFVFFALIAGVFLMALQFLLFFLAVFTGQAFASQAPAGPFKSMFVTENPQTDIAFLMLDYVFGLPGSGGGTTAFFGSNALQGTAGGAAGGPTAFHQGLHALINFYNLAVLLVGVLIFLYYIVVVVIETAQTGVPFGRRFSKLYAPFRLIFAIGLLVPLNYGFNGAQYITLYAAKLGSSFATNGWILYNRSLGGGGGGSSGGTNGGGSENPIGAPNTSLVAKPRTPSIDSLLYFSSVYHSCREIYSIFVPKDGIDITKGGTCIKAYVIVDGKAQVFADSKSTACGSGGGAAGYDYAAAKKQFSGGNMEVVMGEEDPDGKKFKTDPGSVHPWCGKITISLGNDNPVTYKKGADGSSDDSGVRGVEKAYYNTVKKLLEDNTGTLAAVGERFAHFNVPTSSEEGNFHDGCWQSSVLKDSGTCNGTPNPPAASIVDQIFKTRIDNAKLVDESYEALRKGLNLAVSTELERRGWGGAGIWYNHIADINGTFTSAVYAVPTIKQFPIAMEEVKEARMAENKSETKCGIFSPDLGAGHAMKYKTPTGAEIAKAGDMTYKYYACNTAMQETGKEAAAAPAAGGGCGTTGAVDEANVAIGGSAKGLTGNPVLDVMAVVFGINGLYDIRSASCVQGRELPPVHPLAQLSTLGKALLENAIQSMAISIGFAGLGGGITGLLGSSLGTALDTASGMFVMIATIGLTAGFVLYYVLPFLPFIYFFFAVGSWVKSIFEAMVGVPLWALAHLHIDGDGLPGRAALPGYFLIFEIFLRPIVIVFGLIGGMAIFGALVVVLNNIFDLVVLNVTGANPGESTASMVGQPNEVFRRGVVDRFFFTIMYTLMMYMMATASFKMIDTVPNGIMRWISSSVSVFNDNKGDPAGNLTTYITIGGGKISGEILGATRDGAKALGHLSGALMKDMMEGKKNNPNKGPGSGQ